MLKFIKTIFLGIALLISAIALFVGWFFLTIPDPAKIQGCMTTEMFRNTPKTASSFLKILLSISITALTGSK
jgi:hypothetical protein